MTQKEALDLMKSGKNVFLTGEPGAGKTYTINDFRAWARDHHRRVAVTASTGIAATHINGATIHSWSGMGIKKNLTDKQIEQILSNNFVARRLESADVLILDEVSMIGATFLTDLDRLLSKARNFMTDKPFGGIQLVLVGDFFQMPPVSKNYEKKQLFAFRSPAWDRANLEIAYLTEQHRTEDPEFLEILTAMRRGTLTEPMIEKLKQAAERENPLATQLETHNVSVDRINADKLAEIPGEAREYTMSSQGIPFLVMRLKESCLSPEKLELKAGAIVMFTRNKFDEDTGQPIYVNGTVGQVNRFKDNGQPVVWTTDGREVVVEKADWEYEENDVVKASIRQYPLRLGWAMTVHKAQGMSLDSAQIDLSNAFEYGQGYVALSRVRSLDGLFLRGFNKRSLMMHPEVVKQDAIFRKKAGI